MLQSVQNPMTDARPVVKKPGITGSTPGSQPVAGVGATMLPKQPMVNVTSIAGPKPPMSPGGGVAMPPSPITSVAGLGGGLIGHPTTSGPQPTLGGIAGLGGSMLAQPGGSMVNAVGGKSPPTPAGHDGPIAPPVGTQVPMHPAPIAPGPLATSSALAAAPPNAAAAGAAAVPGAATTSFGPQGDLRGTQVLPGQGADRYGIAQQRYDQFLQDSAPGDFDAIRAVGQRAASRGGVGSGIEARGFADTGARIAQAQGSARNSFLGDALEGTIADERANRGEIRTERGYQDDAAQQSIDRRRQQVLDEDQLTGTAFDREERRANDLADVGYRSNPAGTILDAASGQQGVADRSGQSLAELMKQYAYGRSVDPNLAKQGQPGAAPAAGGNVWGAAATRPASFGQAY